MINQKTKILFSSLILLGIFLTLNYVEAADSTQKNYKNNRENRFENKNFSKNHVNCQNCLESEEGNCPCPKNMDTANFEKFEKMRELQKAGDVEGAKLIAEELGLPQKKMNKKENSNCMNKNFEKNCPDCLNKSSN